MIKQPDVPSPIPPTALRRTRAQAKATPGRACLKGRRSVSLAGILSPLFDALSNLHSRFRQY